MWVHWLRLDATVVLRVRTRNNQATVCVKSVGEDNTQLLLLPSSDTGCGWVVQRWKDGVRVLQIQGGRSQSHKGAGKCAQVGREEEGTSSNRPELGGIVRAMQSAALSEDTLLLCDNEAVLCVIKKWVGQGGKATLATAPDADILQEIVCLLTQRVRAGRATFLIKVKSWRTNQRAG